MKSVFGLLILSGCIVAVFSITLPAKKPQCLQNKVYNHCGSACPAECSKLNQPLQGCTKQCVSGCFCPDDSALLANGLCTPINSKQCQDEANGIATCPYSMVYVECGSSCPLKCSNLNDTTPCSTDCVPGCTCSKNFALLDNGQCAPVSSKKCQSQTQTTKNVLIVNNNNQQILLSSSS